MSGKGKQEAAAPRRPVVAGTATGRVYNAIVELTEANGYPPTVREIAGRAGLSSPATVQFHLDTLERGGLITRGPAGSPRTIQVKAP